MTRFSAYKLLSSGNAFSRETFSRCIASLDSLEKMRIVFEDLFSNAEMLMFVRRIHIAKLIIQGEGHKSIINELEAGKDTISKIRSQLERTSGGYALLLHCMKDVEDEIREEMHHAQQTLNPESWESHIKKYSNRYAFIHAERELPKFFKYRKNGKKRRKSV